ncbi:hypothetical protein I317_04299 [Kwoniella heveanensis CBS 569]|nr:hypothetical protein I317_04299 [Kwoniella heveanensis CBS 569]
MPPRTRSASGIVKRMLSDPQPPVKRRRVTKVVKSESRVVVVNASDGTAQDSAKSPVHDSAAISITTTAGPVPSSDKPLTHPSLIPPTLSFSLDEAVAHLSRVDARFGRFFEHIPCRPFVHLEAVDPFRTLVTSIIGQQVSWLAARAINNRFRALFGFLNHDENKGGFPSATAVAKEDVLRLKSVGLSTRKAEYVISLAQHFVSGQLTTELLHRGTDDEISKALIAVRGIGQWTVDMFLMFSLRRPDVLAVGDLGVQKGLLRWFLSAHDALPPSTPKKGTPKKVTSKQQSSVGSAPTPLTPTPIDGAPSDETIAEPPERLPPPTPSPHARQLLRPSRSYTPPELPPDLSVDVLRARLNGKKVKGGMYLTPDEMIRLTEPWRPFRSLGVFYMWPVAEE